MYKMYLAETLGPTSGVGLYSTAKISLFVPLYGGFTPSDKGQAANLIGAFLFLILWKTTGAVKI